MDSVNFDRRADRLKRLQSRQAAYAARYADQRSNWPEISLMVITLIGLLVLGVY